MSESKRKVYLSLSVHQLVDFLLRAGDIDDRIYNQETMKLGTLMHGAYQKKQGKEYLSEYYLCESFERERGTIRLDGRADGIIIGGDYPIIDEIKSTVQPLLDFYEEQGKWHLGQAECYALMYAHEKGLNKIGIRLTYLSQVKDEKLPMDFVYSIKDLEDKVNGYIDDYLFFQQIRFEAVDKRNESCRRLTFPFKKFRKGQRELAKYVYGVASKGGLLFAEAPTGIGKTMSTLFPSVKSFATTENEKIFYLTAKTTGRFSAYEAMGELYKNGFVGRDSLLVAKAKICLSPGKGCNPDECPYAKGYYSKLKGVIRKALDEWNRFDADYVVELAKKELMCPFELQLDLSLYSDVIICDYNYFYDPLVFLERYFDPLNEQKKYIILTDEAHNLVERGRDMYSAEITTASLKAAKNGLRHIKADSIKRALTKIEKRLKDLSGGEDGVIDFVEKPQEVLKAMASLKSANQKAQKSEHPPFGDAYKDFFLEVNKFLRLLDDFYGPGMKIYLERYGKNIKLKLACLDAASYLKDNLDRVKGAVVFSATLSPIDYYQDAIIGSHDEPFLLLSSPFDKNNFHLMLAPKVSVRYKDRASTYQEVYEYLKNFVDAKQGNYFLYFPSYEYLDNIRPYLDFGDAEVLVQEREMSEFDREEFLSHFVPNPSKTTIGLLILGGAFSEGIDLVSDRLIGVALVGIGLPQIGHDNNLIRDYYDKKEDKGFDYAYRDPGMNKVMQAVGRLIRSESDRGAALLIDDRYMTEEYRSLFRRIWDEYEVVTSPSDVTDSLREFYQGEKAKD